MKTRNNNWVRFCTIMVFAIYSCMTLHAQSAFHVYRKDGTVNTFFYLNLDSISYTNATSDEGENFIQEVHTPDSVYRIPVNEIDSVSFHQPETVYQPGVVRIEEKLFPYVIKQDSLTLIVDGNVPSQLLPDIGDKLVTLEMSDVLPAGFVGEVVGVTKESGNYTIECQLPLLTDIFSSYYYEGSILLDNTGEGVSTRANTDPVWPPVTQGITLPDIVLPVSFLDVVAIDKEWASASLSHDGTFTLKSQMLIHTSLRVSDGVHFHLTMTGKHSLDTDLSIAVKGTVKHKWGKEKQAPIAVAPLIKFYMDCGPFFELTGSLATQIGFTQYFNSALHYEYDQGKPSNIPSLCTFISKGLDVNKAEVVGNLSFRAGVDLEAGVSIASTEISKAGIACYAGLGLELGMNLSDAPSIASPPDTTIYEKNKGKDLVSVSALVGAALRAKCFVLENSVGVECVSQPLFERGLFPDFNNVKADMSKGNAGELYAMADVSRRCLGKRRVGFALYNNNELLDKAYYDTYYDGKNDLSISHIFKGLTPGKKYKVYPIVEIFGNSEMLATPGKEVKLSANVVTGASSDVTSTSAVLAGFIEGLDEKTTGEYGIAYKEAEKQEWIEQKATSINNGHYTCTVTGLNPDTDYDYRAYYQVDGEQTCGEILSFKTKEEIPILAIVSGNEQRGRTGDTLDSLLVVSMTSNTSTSIQDKYEVGFEIVSGGGKIVKYEGDLGYNKYGARWTLGTEGEQKVKAYIISKESMKEVGEPVYFTASIYHEYDRDNLIRFYHSAEGENWKSNFNWLSDRPISQWKGIFCDDNNEYVETLFLEDNNLKGDAVLSDFKKLQFIHLEKNDMNSLTIKDCPEFSLYHSLSGISLKKLTLIGDIKASTLSIWNSPRTEINNLYMKNINDIMTVHSAHFGNLISDNVNVSKCKFENLGFSGSSINNLFIEEAEVGLLLYDNTNISTIQINNSNSWVHWYNDTKVETIQINNSTVRNIDGIGATIEVTNSKIEYTLEDLDCYLIIKNSYIDVGTIGESPYKTGSYYVNYVEGNSNVIIEIIEKMMEEANEQ